MSEQEPFRGVLYWDSETKSFKEKRKEHKTEAPAVITDEIPETESMATDKREHFTSKRKYYDHLKAHGYHVKERGEDNVAPKKKSKEEHIREIRDAAEKAYMDIKYDRIPFDEKEKQKWKEEERQYREWMRRNGL